MTRTRFTKAERRKIRLEVSFTRNDRKKEGLQVSVSWERRKQKAHAYLVRFRYHPEVNRVGNMISLLHISDYKNRGYTLKHIPIYAVLELHDGRRLRKNF